MHKESNKLAIAQTSTNTIQQLTRWINIKRKSRNSLFDTTIPTCAIYNSKNYTQNLLLHPAMLQTQTKFSNYMKIIKSKTQHKQKFNLQIR